MTATLARVAARERWLSVRSTSPAGETGWHRTSQLLTEPGALVRLIAQGAEALASDHPGAAPGVCRTVAAAVLLSDWSWAVAAVGGGALAADRRVPDLDPEGVHLRVVEGRVTGVAATRPTFACAAGDPDAADPYASVHEDLDEALRSRLTQHLTPLHERLRVDGLLRQGPRAMWGSAGDGVAAALRLQADATPEPEALLTVAERVLAGAPRCWGQGGFERVADDAGAVSVLRQRTSCCFYYRLPATPPCGTCPRTGAAGQSRAEAARKRSAAR